MSKKQIFKVHTEKEGAGFYRKVKGELVDLELPELKNHTFFIHHPYSEIPGKWRPQNQDKWHVSEVQTGYSMGRGQTKDEAIRNAQYRAAKVSEKEFDSMIRAGVAKNEKG